MFLPAASTEINGDAKLIQSPGDNPSARACLHSTKDPAQHPPVFCRRRQNWPNSGAKMSTGRNVSRRYPGARSCKCILLHDIRHPHPPGNPGLAEVATRCGKMARHTPRKLARANPACSGVEKNERKRCLAVAPGAETEVWSELANIGQTCLQLGRRGPKFGKSRKIWAALGENWPMLADVGRCRAWAEFGRCWPIQGRCRQIPGRTRPKCGQFRQMSAEFGKCLPNSTKMWSTIGT